MGNYSLKNIRPANEKDFSQGVYIILFNATSIPPHLLLSVHGKIFSITDSGRQMGSSLEKLILFVKRKNVPTIFVEWNLLESWNVEMLESVTRKCFLKYDKVVEGKISCLFPIRDVAAQILGKEMNAANFIFDLLPRMENNNAVGKSYFLNMQIMNGEFELLTYTEEQLQEALQFKR